MGQTKGPFDDLVVLMKKVAGTVLLDFDADACQSPSRAYLLDVTLPGMYIKCGINLIYH